MVCGLVVCKRSPLCEKVSTSIVPFSSPFEICSPSLINTPDSIAPPLWSHRRCARELPGKGAKTIPAAERMRLVATRNAADTHVARCDSADRLCTAEAEASTHLPHVLQDAPAPCRACRILQRAGGFIAC